MWFTSIQLSFLITKHRIITKFSYQVILLASANHQNKKINKPWKHFYKISTVILAANDIKPQSYWNQLLSRLCFSICGIKKFWIVSLLARNICGISISTFKKINSNDNWTRKALLSYFLAFHEWFLASLPQNQKFFLTWPSK